MMPRQTCVYIYLHVILAPSHARHDSVLQHVQDPHESDFHAHDAAQPGGKKPSAQVAAFEALPQESILLTFSSPASDGASTVLSWKSKTNLTPIQQDTTRVIACKEPDPMINNDCIID